MSPDPIWNIVLIGLSLISFANIFIFVPIAYLMLCRPFDKRYRLQNYTIEKGLWFFSAGVRIASYALGILLQPYRERKIENRLLTEFVRRRFVYQDKAYGKKEDFTESVTKLQLAISVIFWLGVLIFLLMLIAFGIHDFIVYPEVGKARLANNH
jgi:hypothetical protein